MFRALGPLTILLLTVCAPRLGLWLALAALPLLPGLVQASATVPPSSVSTALKAIPTCASNWSNRIATPIQVTDTLKVSVPVKYIRYELLTCGSTTDGVPRDGPAGSSSVSFEFFLPDFGGFTDKTLYDSFALNEVEVAYVVSAGKLGFHPSDPAKLESTQAENVVEDMADPNKYQDLYGLRCYEGKIAKNRMFCSGLRSGNDHAEILFQVDAPPYGPGVVNPIMQTEYFSQRYGGIEVKWWTNVKNMPHWLEIDAQIWKFLSAWNVAQVAK